jgi:hypothetical protein
LAAVGRARVQRRMTCATCAMLATPLRQIETTLHVDVKSVRIIGKSPAYTKYAKYALRKERKRKLLIQFKSNQ